MEHFYVKFGDPSCISFSNIVWKNRHSQTNEGNNPTPATASAWVMMHAFTTALLKNTTNATT